jgi:hypothetical protein
VKIYVVETDGRMATWFYDKRDAHYRCAELKEAHNFDMKLAIVAYNIERINDE